MTSHYENPPTLEPDDAAETPVWLSFIDKDGDSSLLYYFVFVDLQGLLGNSLDSKRKSIGN